MTKPISHWEDVLKKARAQKQRFLRIREELAPDVLEDPPSKWRQAGGRWVQKNPFAYRCEILLFHQNQVKWGSVNRALARVERSIAHAEERIASQKNVWDHLRLGAKQTAREARRRCIPPE